MDTNTNPPTCRRCTGTGHYPTEAHQCWHCNGTGVAITAAVAAAAADRHAAAVDTAAASEAGHAHLIDSLVAARFQDQPPRVGRRGATPNHVHYANCAARAAKAIERVALAAALNEAPAAVDVDLAASARVVLTMSRVARAAAAAYQVR